MDTPELIDELRKAANLGSLGGTFAVDLLLSAAVRLEELTPKPFDFDEAVAQHVAEQTPGALLDTYVFQARYKTVTMAEAGESGYLSSCPEGQSIDQTLGLLRYATVQAERYALQVRRPDEDDE